MNDETKNHDKPDAAKHPAKPHHKPKHAVEKKPEEKPAPKPTSKVIPDCPEMDPILGDKTPAVVAWWFEHHPEEAAAKYEGRKIQTPGDHE